MRIVPTALLACVGSLVLAGARSRLDRRRL